MKRYEKVLIPELNLGQLRTDHSRPSYLVDAVGLNKVQGKPFTRRRSDRDKIAELAK